MFVNGTKDPVAPLGLAFDGQGGHTSQNAHEISRLYEALISAFEGKGAAISLA